MDRLDALRQQPSRENVTLAIEVLQNDELSFADKVAQVQALEDRATGYELELFGDIYSSLHNLASSADDINLISGK